MYIYLRISEQEECLINPNCRVCLFLEFIENILVHKAEIDIYFTKNDIELCDDSYCVRGLCDANPRRNCVEMGILKPRGHYFAIVLDKSSGNGYANPILPLAESNRFYRDMFYKVSSQLKQTGKLPPAVNQRRKPNPEEDKKLEVFAKWNFDRCITPVNEDHTFNGKHKFKQRK